MISDERSSLSSMPFWAFQNKKIQTKRLSCVQRGQRSHRHDDDCRLNTGLTAKELIKIMSGLGDLSEFLLSYLVVCCSMCCLVHLKHEMNEYQKGYWLQIDWRGQWSDQDHQTLVQMQSSRQTNDLRDASQVDAGLCETTRMRFWALRKMWRTAPIPLCDSRHDHTSFTHANQRQVNNCHIFGPKQGSDAVNIDLKIQKQTIDK